MPTHRKVPELDDELRQAAEWPCPTVWHGVVEAPPEQHPGRCGCQGTGYRFPWLWAKCDHFRWYYQKQCPDCKSIGDYHLHTDNAGVIE